MNDATRKLVARIRHSFAANAGGDFTQNAADFDAMVAALDATQHPTISPDLRAAQAEAWDQAVNAVRGEIQCIPSWGNSKTGEGDFDMGTDDDGNAHPYGARKAVFEAIGGVVNPYRASCDREVREDFVIREQEKCVCGMRVFEVHDLIGGDVTRAHVGTLNPHDKAHEAVRELLGAERERLTNLTKNGDTQ